MSDRYYMSNIYTPERHDNWVVTKSLLPLVRELNFNQGLKVGGVDERNRVVMCYPNGLRACLVWYGIDSHDDDKKSKFFLSSPLIKKSRGRDDEDRMTIRAVSLGRLTGLIDKYGALSEQGAAGPAFHRVISSSTSYVRTSITAQYKAQSFSRIRIEDDLIDAVMRYAADSMNLFPDKKYGAMPDMAELRKVVQQIDTDDEGKKNTDKDLRTIYSNKVLVIGGYAPFGDSELVGGVVGIIDGNNLFEDSKRVEIVKPFQYVRSFEDVLTLYPDAITQVMMCKMNEELLDSGQLLLGLFGYKDFYDPNVPYASYFLRRSSVFDMCWLFMPYHGDVNVTGE